MRGYISADSDIYTIYIEEPGDKEWDGKFEIRVPNDFKLIGEVTWKSNNGKLNNKVSIQKVK